jgi:hypothetical protein
MALIAKAGAILLADPVAVECLEVLERREVKQHHNEQHLGARQLAWALPGLLQREQPMRFPVCEQLAEVIETEQYSAVMSIAIEGALQTRV